MIGIPQLESQRRPVAGGAAGGAATPGAPDPPQRPLNVLVVTPIYPWPDAPAEGIFVHRQLRHLMRLGVRCRVIRIQPAVFALPPSLVRLSWLRYHPRWLTWSATMDGVEVRHLFYPRHRRRGADVIPAARAALVHYVESHPEFADTDVVYAHWMWPGGAAALGLRERFGWPVAAIARGSDMHGWHGVHPYCREHVVRVLDAVDLPLANCEGLRRRAEALAPDAARRMEVVYNGCDAESFSPTADRARLRRSLRLPVDAPILLCCATMAAHKGYAELAAAWATFSLRHPAWRLVTVGPVANRALARRLRAVCGDALHLVGAVPADRVRLYLQAADAYVQPSHYEGLANATLEAMACGLPVVATQVDGQVEAVRHGETGWLVPPRDPCALAHALSELAADPAAASERGARARQHVIAHFDPVVQATRLAGLLAAVGRRQAPAVAGRVGSRVGR
jgi:glycosyltransferase involved in cell wall biosynthesis